MHVHAANIQVSPPIFITESTPVTVDSLQGARIVGGEIVDGWECPKVILPVGTDRPRKQGVVLLQDAEDFGRW